MILIALTQFAGTTPKLRPALLLAELPGPYQNILLCGISTQLHQIEPQWDELIQTSDPDFPSTGLHRDSIIRLSYLHATDPNEIRGAIGSIEQARLQRLLHRLSDHLRP